VKKGEKIDAVLPKTGGFLANLMQTFAIQDVNKPFCATLLKSPSVTEIDAEQQNIGYNL